MSYSYSILTILVSFESSRSTDCKSENFIIYIRRNILNQQKISGKNRKSDGMLSSTNSEVFELPKSVTIFGNFDICSSITKRWLQDLVLQRRLAVLLLIRSIWNSASSFDNVLCIKNRPNRRKRSTSFILHLVWITSFNWYVVIFWIQTSKFLLKYRALYRDQAVQLTWLNFRQLIL